MNWRKWILGCAVSLFLSLVVAGTGYEAGMSWKAFVAVLCTSIATHFGAYLTEHPVEKIEFDQESKS